MAEFEIIYREGYCEWGGAERRYRMNKWDRDFFDSKCPYTDKPCDLDIDCLDCDVNKQEKEEMAKMDDDEYREWLGVKHISGKKQR